MTLGKNNLMKRSVCGPSNVFTKRFVRELLDYWLSCPRRVSGADAREFSATSAINPMRFRQHLPQVNQNTLERVDEVPQHLARVKRNRIQRPVWMVCQRPLGSRGGRKQESVRGQVAPKAPCTFRRAIIEDYQRCHRRRKGLVPVETRQI